MFKWFSKLNNEYKIYRSNKENFKKFENDISVCCEGKDNIFAKYGLIFSPDHTKITAIINIPENFAQYPDPVAINLYIQKEIKPINDYLIYGLNWVEYISLPTIYHLEDEETNIDENEIKDGSKVSLTYLIVWEWQSTPHQLKYWQAKLIGSITAGFSLVGGAITTALLLL